MGTYLNRTLSSPNVLKHTTSLWMKGSPIGTNNYIFSLTSGGHYIFLRRNTSNQLESRLINGAVEIGALVSNNLLRDPASWYHVVLRVDIANSTANNRLRIYLNGSEISYATQTQPSGHAAASYTQFRTLSANTGNTNDPFLGYMADLNHFDGYSYGPDSFGETDSTTGEWKPKVDFTGVTYGTNGFRCEFGNAAALGTDTSGNSNTLTVNNAGTGAQTVDTADNNFCTLSPLSEGADATLTKGNLEISYGNNTRTCSTANMGVSSGKWYWEFKTTAISASPNPVMVGIGELPYGPDLGTYLGQNASGWGYAGEDGTVYNSGSGSAYGATYTTGDIIGVAFDADNGNLYFYKNGTIQNSGTAAATGLTSSSTGFYYPAVGKSSGVRTFTAQANFGNSPFTIASGNADANGFGNFEYAVPSGYYALCTKNINSYG